MQGEIKLNDFNLERKILSCMLFEDDKATSKCIIELNEDDFYNANYRQIFNIMREMFENSTHIDVITLNTAINKHGLSNVLPNHMIFDMAAEASTTAYVNRYIEELKEMRYRRKIAEYSSKVHKAAKSEIELKNILEIMSNFPTIEEKEIEKTPEIIAIEAIERAKLRLKNGLSIPGSKTGLITLDVLAGGIKESELILISAEPNVGKSLLALQICIEFAKRRETALYFNYEMNEKQIGDRLVAIGVPFDISKLKSPSGNTTLKELDSVKLDKSLNQHLYIYSNTRKTIADIMWKCKEIKAKGKKIDLIAADYLQLMNGEGSTDLEKIESLSKGLKNIATEFNCPVIVISSLNREGKLRGSHQLDFDADQIWHLSREHNAESEDIQAYAKLEVTKNRDGGKGVIDLFFNDKHLRFYSLQAENVTQDKIIEEFREDFKQEKLNL